MDDSLIEQGLRDVLLAEPPLRIDPDELADVAARRQRNHRAGIATGVGVLAVAGIAAGAVAFTSGTSPGPGVPSAIQVGDPTTPPPPADPGERNLAHLRQVLPGMLPGAHDIKVTGSWDRGKDQPQLTVLVTLVDSAGPGRFELTISNLADTIPAKSDMCGPRYQNPKAMGLPSTAGVHCTKTPRPAGDTLAILELDGTSGRASLLQVFDYRDGHHSVSLLDGGETINGSARGHVLTKDQLITLATDQALTVA